MGKYVKRLPSSRWQKVWGSCVCAYYVNFQFSHAYTRLFCPTNYKKLQNIFNVVTNKDKTETQNALCNFSKSPHMCKLLIVWLGALCGLCILPYIKACVLHLFAWLIRLFIWSWLVWALSAWERECVLTVLCICKCICKIYYTL